MSLVVQASARRLFLLSCVLGAGVGGWAGVGGCGVVGDARVRLEAFLADDAAPATSPEAAVPVEGEGEAGPMVVARAGSSGVGGSSGAESDPTDASDSSDGGTGAHADADADTATDTGLLPMSYARPPGPPGPAGVRPGAPGGPSVVPPTPPIATPPIPTPPIATPPIPTPPSPSGSDPLAACLEGEWDADDLHTWFRRDIAEQAHGRPVRFRGESGRHRLRFAAGVLHGAAKHRRIAFDARLANVDIRYSVDVHGEFEATFRSESPDVLVVERPVRSTLRVREVVRFSAEKSETRTLELPVEGRWQASCSPGALELRPLEGTEPGPALKFVRPKP
jgi:hypothetical protein